MREMIIDGSTPVMLNDESKMFLLESGHINIFVVKKSSNDKSWKSKRKFVFDARDKDIIFQISKSLNGTDYSLLAVPTVKSKLIEFEVNSKSNVSYFEAKNLDIQKCISNWISKLKSVENINLNFNSENLDDTTFEEVKNYNSCFFDKCIDLLQRDDKKDVRRIKEKTESDSFLLNDAYKGLNSLIHLKWIESIFGKSYSKVGQYNDDVAKVCALVAGRSKIKLKIPKEDDCWGKISQEDKIIDISKSSNVKVRQVELKSGWYKKSGGSFVGFNKDGNVVALIEAGKKYVMYNPRINSKEKVNKENVDNISSKAFMFYRPLPDHSVSLKELFKFTISGINVSDMVMIVMMTLLSTLVGLIVPSITGKIYDTIIPSGERNQILSMWVFMILTCITSFGFGIARSFSVQRVNAIIQKDLQSAMMDRVLSLPVNFFKQKSTGELTQDLLGITQIQSVLSGIVINTVLTSCFSVLYVIMMFVYCPTLSWCGLAFILVSTVVLGIQLMVDLKYEKKQVDIDNKISGHTYEWISGQLDIKLARAEKRVFSLWSDLFMKSNKNSIIQTKLSNSAAIFNSVISLVFSMVFYVMFVYNQSKSVSVGQYMAFNSSFQQFFSAVTGALTAMTSILSLKPLIKRVTPFLQTVPEFNSEKESIGNLDGNIEINHIKFSYSKDGPLILDDVSLNIKKGEFVGIVGPSGSGKSTLFRLLLGFENTYNGEIFFDGCNMRKINTESLRKKFGVVLQNNQLIPGSILENVRGVNMKLKEEDIWTALRLAGIEDDVKSMPMGLFTMIDEGSSAISGGQRQRILIARAIASDPKILFFDEATSSLDNATQDLISKNLENINITRVVIAHRLSTVIGCDKIFFLNNGKILEQGNYEELMALDGMFAKMAKRQII